MLLALITYPSLLLCSPFLCASYLSGILLRAPRAYPFPASSSSTIPPSAYTAASSCLACCHACALYCALSGCHAAFCNLHYTSLLYLPYPAYARMLRCALPLAAARRAVAHRLGISARALPRATRCASGARRLQRRARARNRAVAPYRRMYMARGKPRNIVAPRCAHAHARLLLRRLRLRLLHRRRMA